MNVIMDILCFYDPKNGHHNSVVNVTNSKTVFSMAGELSVRKKLVQMIMSEIEWMYPSSKKGNTSEKRSLCKKVRLRHLDFEDKYMKSSNNLKRKSMNYNNSYNGKSSTSMKKKNIFAGCDQQEEVDAVSRGIPKLTKLADAMNIVTNNDKNNKGKGCKVLLVENKF